MKYIDLTGQKFGRLKVLYKAEKDTRKSSFWVCRCDCGNEKSIKGSHLRSGSTTSCGCFHLERSTKHGKCSLPEYNVYYNMIKRCEYKSNKAFKDYGGRGIKVCPEWRQSFEQFYKDMGPRPSDKHSIDRVDFNGDYSPSNCRWATQEIQDRNKRVRKNSKTGVRGVTTNKDNKYVAQIRVNGKVKRIGTYISLEEATAARKDAEEKYWNSEEVMPL